MAWSFLLDVQFPWEPRPRQQEPAGFETSVRFAVFPFRLRCYQLKCRLRVVARHFGSPFAVSRPCPSRPWPLQLPFERELACATSSSTCPSDQAILDVCRVQQHGLREERRSDQPW